MFETIEKRVRTVTLNIREQRLTKNYTQEYLAGKLGVSQNAYSKLELGITGLTIKRLFIIADTLDIDIKQLIGE